MKDYLASEPYPHYFAHPEEKDLVIREDENGRRVAGRFVNRKFVAVKRWWKDDCRLEKGIETQSESQTECGGNCRAEWRGQEHLL